MQTSDITHVGPGVVESGGRVGGNVTREPAEQAEEGSKSVDSENGTNELPRRERDVRLSTSKTGDEDEPVLGKRDFEEENLLDVTKVLHDTTALEEEGTAEDPGAHGKQYTEDDGNDPDLGQLPLDGSLGVGCVVVSNGNGGQVGEEGNEDNQVGADRLVENDDGQDEVNLQVETQTDTVLDVSLHAVENLTGDLDGGNDGRETLVKENDIGGRASSVRGTFDGDTTVGLLERGSVVDTVTSHGSQVTTVLEHLDDLVLVFGEDLSETVGSLDKVVDCRASHATRANQTLRVVNLGTEGKHLAGLLGDSDGVTSKHLDRDTKGLGLSNGGGSVGAGRVEHGEETEELPLAVVDRNTKGTETTRGKVTSDLAVLGGSLGVRGAKLENGVGGTLGSSVALAVLLDLSSDTLGDGVEGGELVGDPARSELVLGAGVVLEGRDGNLVNGVERADVVRRGESGDGHHEVDVNTLRGERLVDGQLVGGKCTSLVRAENVDTGKRLNGGKLLDDSLALGEVSGTDSHGGGGDARKTDGDTNDEEDEGVDEQVVVPGGGDTSVAEEARDPEGEDEDEDKDEERATDGAHDLLEVTFGFTTQDEGSGATDERLLGNVRAEDVTFTTLATGSVEDGVTNVLVDGERFTSDGRLVAGNDRRTLVDTLIIVVVVPLGGASLLEDSGSLRTVLVIVFGEQATIAGNSLTVFDNDNVTGDEVTGFNLLFLTITDNGSPESDTGLKLGDNVTGLLLLVPTDESVQEKNTANDTGVDEFTKTKGEDGSQLHDCVQSKRSAYIQRKSCKASNYSP